VKRVRPAAIVGHDYISAVRTEVSRPEGVTFVRSAAPGSLGPIIGTKIVLPVLWAVANLFWWASLKGDRAGLAVFFQVAFALAYLTVAAFGVRTVVRRTRAAKDGRWPNGLTLWPDRLISFVSDAEAIVAPRAAIDGVTIEDDGTISVHTTDAYGTTTTTKLGVFSGEPDALRRLLDTWFASSDAAA